MGQNDSRKKLRIWEKESFSFILSLISVSIVFIFLGYLMGYNMALANVGAKVTGYIECSPTISQY